MNSKSRITSILKNTILEKSITGIEPFNLSCLILTKNINFELPHNIRLGHIIEKVVSELLHLSENYNILYESVQLIENKKTIGEIDFIIQNMNNSELIHLELAYKFYLLDPSTSSELIDKWIGPNRNDTLKNKLEKLKTKQFPLLNNNVTTSSLPFLKTSKISQKLCFFSSLFIPLNYKENLPQAYTNAIEGYYINYNSFINFNHNKNRYYIPSKKEWGIQPTENKSWSHINNIKEKVKISIEEQQSVLCWQKNLDSFTSLFIVWW